MVNLKQTSQNIEALLGIDSLNLETLKLNEYGRPKNTYFLNRVLTKNQTSLNLFYLQSDKTQSSSQPSTQTQIEQSSIFSFDKSQYQLLTDKIQIISQNIPQLQIQNPYMITKLTQSKDSENFNLNSQIYTNSELDNSIHYALRYLTLIVENPTEILSNKNLQNQFEQSIKQLKKHSISLEQIFELKQEFSNQTQLPGFLMLDQKQNLYNIQAKEQAQNSNLKLTTGKNKIMSQNKVRKNAFGHLVLKLDLKPDGIQIENMKANLRKSFTQTNNTSKKSLRALKQSIQQTLESTEQTEFFGLNEYSSIEEILQTTSQNQLEQFFPFQREDITDIEFLRDYMMKSY